MRKLYHYSIFVIAFCLCFASAVSSEEEAAVKPVARVYEKSIYLEEILPNKRVAVLKRKELSSEDYTEWEKDYKFKRLSATIWHSLYAHFIEENALQAKEEEVQSYINFHKKRKIESIKEFYAHREELQKKITVGQLNEKEFKDVAKQLEILNNLISYEKKEQERARNTPNYDEMRDKVLQGIAVRVTGDWKFNKGLYEKFGGRVIFQQAGLEPIDAYKAFLEGHLKDKDYEFFDPSLIAAFDNMQEYFQMGHNFLSQKEGRKYFDKPCWDIIN